MSIVHTHILLPDSIQESQLSYVVIAARENEKWIFVRHRERKTWEMPAGHIESEENAKHAAYRELQEETGTVRATLKHLCDYQVTLGEKTESGQLYSAEVHEREPNLEHEIVEVRLSSDLPSSLTYPEVQTVLFDHAKELLRS